jgi:L-threonylcarbamoyladenylate synthase
VPRVVHSLVQAARCLSSGGILAYPTEAVFGIGCLPAFTESLEQIRRIKQRHEGQGLILITDRPERLAPYILPLSAAQQARIRRQGGRPRTWLVPARPECPQALRGHSPYLAIRISGHPVVRRLCQLTGSALVSTSANRRGQPPAINVDQVQSKLGLHLDCILDAPLGKARTVSEIRHLHTGQRFR